MFITGGQKDIAQHDPAIRQTGFNLSARRHGDLFFFQKLRGNGKRFHPVRIKPVAYQAYGIFTGTANTEPGVSPHCIKAVKVNMPDNHGRYFLALE
jgi:hypothetical protein